MHSIWSDLLSSNVPGFVFSMLVPLLFLIFMVKDKQSKYILSFFSWGVFSVIIAYLLNNWFVQTFEQDSRVTSDIAPIIEEAIKALPLLLFLKKKNCKSNLIIYCAMASGIGFSVQETLYYFSSLTINTGVSELFLVIIRTLTTCLMHGMSTAVLGFGITITAQYKNIRVPMFLGLLALASTIHSLFNILLGTQLAIISVIMPAVLYLLGLALLSAEKE